MNTILKISFFFTAILLIIVNFSFIRKNKNVFSLPTGDTICLADPTIFLDKGIYYLYGTGEKDGFKVYESTDLKNWSGPVGKQHGYALLKGNSYGTQGFWAPQVIKLNGRYYMTYAANEHIAIAESNSPLGPFTQKKINSISEPGKQIDPYIFKDKNGQLFLYHVRLQNGNRIFVTRLKKDLSDIDQSPIQECISADQPWENTKNVSWGVTEGPTVIRHKNYYYLFYSANDFHNIDYAVGYAIATSPLGPWKKYIHNPILSREITGQNGTGHGDFFVDKAGVLTYVFHTHHSNTEVGKRKTAIIRAAFTSNNPPQITLDTNSFRFLELNNTTTDKINP